MRDSQASTSDVTGRVESQPPADAFPRDPVLAGTLGSLPPWFSRCSRLPFPDSSSLSSPCGRGLVDAVGAAVPSVISSHVASRRVRLRRFPRWPVEGRARKRQGVLGTGMGRGPARRGRSGGRGAHGQCGAGASDLAASALLAPATSVGRGQPHVSLSVLPPALPRPGSSGLSLTDEKETLRRPDAYLRDWLLGPHAAPLL